MLSLNPWPSAQTGSVTPAGSQAAAGSETSEALPSPASLPDPHQVLKQGDADSLTAVGLDWGASSDALERVASTLQTMARDRTLRALACAGARHDLPQGMPYAGLEVRSGKHVRRQTVLGRTPCSVLSSVL